MTLHLKVAAINTLLLLRDERNGIPIACLLLWFTFKKLNGMTSQITFTSVLRFLISKSFISQYSLMIHYFLIFIIRGYYEKFTKKLFRNVSGV